MLLQIRIPSPAPQAWGTCLPKFPIQKLVDRYELSADARGYSDATVTHVKISVGKFDDFLSGISNVRKVKADDFRVMSPMSLYLYPI